jgi:hypothetical protein
LRPHGQRGDHHAHHQAAARDARRHRGVNGQRRSTRSRRSTPTAPVRYPECRSKAPYPRNRRVRRASALRFAVLLAERGATVEARGAARRPAASGAGDVPRPHRGLAVLGSGPGRPRSAPSRSWSARRRRSVASTAW